MKVMNLQTESLKRWKYHSHLFKGLDRYVTRCCASILCYIFLVTPVLANDYALDFDGSNDYVRVDMSLPTGDFTYSAWVKYDSNNDETLFMASSGIGTNEFLMYSGFSSAGGGADICIATNNAVRAYSNDNWLTTGVWHHIATTRSGSTVKLYGDGVLKDSGTDATALSFGSCDLLIGVDADGGCVSSLANYLNGQIDEIRIWNIALTQQEILNNMNIELAGNESGLVAYYKMSDGSGTSLTDNSNNSNDGTLTNMVTDGASSDWVTATSPVSSNGDYSLNFDGSNDYVKTGGVFSDLGTSQSYTISAWINVSTGETDGDIIWMSSYSAGNGWCIPLLSIDVSKIRAFSYNTSIGGFSAYDTESIITNIWYHAVTTWDATNGLRLFVDGELKSTNSTLTYNASGGSNYIWFGYGCCDCLGMQGYFNGAIDDVGIWNTALDADAISAIYNSGTPINLTSNSGNYDEYTDNLIGYYRFSENNGTTAYDISGNANHGTLTNGPTYSYPGADKTAPAVPTGLIATPGNTQVVLTWTANGEGDLASYKVYGGTSSNPTTLLSTVSAGTETYTHTGLTNGTSYYYRISSVDDAGNESSASSNVVTLPHDLDGNYALDFDGSNDYIDCGNDASLKITGSSITLSAWIRADYFATNRWDNSIIDFHGSYSGYGLRCGGSGILSFYLGNGTSWYEIYSSANALSTGEWYFVVGTYDGSTQRIYVNGTQVSSKAWSFSIVATTSLDFYIGESDSSPGRWFDGRIDEVAVWNTALDADAISAIYNSGTPINLTSNSGNYDEYTDNLKGSWRFSENNGTTAYDISGNANHGTLTNGPTYTTPGAGLWIYSTATGNWNSTSTWSYGVVPTSSKSVRIKHDVTLNTSPTIVALTVDASKTLTCGSYTLTATGASDINGTVTSSTGTFDANGAFDANGGAITFSGAGSLNLSGAVTGLGTFTESTSTVTYDGTTQTIDGDDYYNLVLSGGTKTLGGNITVNGDLTNNANAALSMSTYNVSIGGDLTIANGATWTKGSGTVTFDAASNQTLTDNNGTPQNLGTVVVD